ncbi:hypothetical protein GCM10023186_26100 [Hymenobacter koreensis]|uniref:Secretion system C-terminal sorting domain-containing protein n=2 Tax=Hymenobacter koreensis TaxID=1084523 RepID=A0ABP8J335_9BACT
MLPFAGIAQQAVITLTPNQAGDPQDFGSITVGQVSAPKTYTLSGSNLNRSVNVFIPEGFQGSLNATTGYTDNTGAIITVPRTSGQTLANTTIYLRFAPSAATGYDDFLTAGYNPPPVNSNAIRVVGTGLQAPPEIFVNPTAVAFQPQVVNTQSAPQSVTVTSNSLTGPIDVVAPAGFLVSYNGSPYASTVSLPSSGGILNVVFQPSQVGNFVSNIILNSANAQSKSIAVSGQGQSVPASLTVTYSPNPLAFPATQEGTASQPLSFTVNAAGLGSNPVVITAPSDYQVRVGTGAFSSTATIAPVSGAVNNVTVDVRFTPTTTGNRSQTITVAAANAPTQVVNVTGQGTQAPQGATLNVTPTTLDFGDVTQSGSANILTLTVSGTRLGTNPITLTPSNPNIQIRNASAGGAFSSSALLLPSSVGTVSPTTIEVRLVAPIAGGAFNQNILVTSPGADAVTVLITATSNGNVSDISITNPNNNTFTFATRPTTVSAAQTFLISGTNLLQDITVFPTGPSGFYFEVSKDGITYSKSITFGRDNQGNVLQAPVYVRFVPGNDAVTVNALIRATSSPAPDRDVSVTGISEPTVRLVQPLGFFGDAVVKNTKSAAKSVRLEAFLLTGPLNLSFPDDNEDPQRNPDRTPQFEFSTDGGATYVKSDTLLNNVEGNRVINLLVRYAPTRVGASTQSLTFQNAALYSNAPFTLPSGNGTASGFAIAEVPGAQSTAIIVRAPGSTVATITFDLDNPPAGQSYGQNRLVIATTTYSQLPVRLFPQIKQNFTPGITVGGNYQFGSGSAIETSSNTYVVFSGAANSFTVGNLDPNVRYYFYAFEFNDDGLLNAENYKVPNNQPQVPLPVELVSFTAKARNGRVVLDWVTAQEKNNQGFEVLRSRDGRNFSKIGFVEGRGTTSARTAYNYVDNAPLNGTSFYRLKQLDTDGNFSLSPVQAVVVGDAAEMALFPNPVVDVLNITLGDAAADARVTVSDLLGRTVLSQPLPANGQVDLRTLKPGTYLVNVVNGKQRLSRKVVKQ